MPGAARGITPGHARPMSALDTSIGKSYTQGAKDTMCLAFWPGPVV